MNTDKVLWSAMVFSTVVYAGTAYVTQREPAGSFEDGLKQQYTLVLYGLALASFVTGLVLPGLMRSPARLKMVVALAIFESCAIFGLLAAFLAHDWRLFVPPWIASLIGMMRVYPSADSAENQHVAR